MKPVLTRPLSHHLLLFRPTSTTTTTTSISFSTSNLSINTPSLHTLSSFLLLTSTPTTIPTSPSPLNPQSNELPNTHFPSSPTQPNPTSPDPSPPQFTHTWPVSSPRSDPFSKFIHPVDPSPSNTHFLISPNQPTPHHQFTHRRPFSSARSDPSSIEPPPPNEIPVVSTVTSPFDSSASIDAGSSIRKPISLWPGIYHSPVTNALWEARSSIFEKPQELPIGDASESELVPKTPAQSRTNIIYKFSSDYILREQYRNPWNEIRTGKLLEDLDALAGTISVKHCCNEDSTTRPLLLVTASVDRIVLKKPIRVDTDLKIVGAVTWVGRSSMEIRLEVIQPTQEASKPSDSLALTANFTFVARDSKTGKSAPINQISPETQQEKLLWREAENRNQIRKKKKGENKKDINDREADRLKALLAEGRVFCDMPALADRDSILIKDTRLEYSFICQPQQRNIHGRIFGGFLMRKAFELAFSTTYAFAGAAPLFLEVDHVDFLKPVDVGNFLRLKSCVLYTELENLTQPLINVEVVAHVTSPELRSSEVSNTFYFTYTVRPEATKNGLIIRNVVPASEEEARRVLERMDAENPELVQSRNRVII